MNHNTAYQHEREWFNSRREKKILNNFLRFYFTTAVVPFTLMLVRGVVLHMHYACMFGYRTIIAERKHTAYVYAQQSST